MELLRDGVIAFLAAVGLSALLWLLAEWIFSRRERELSAVLLVPLTGGGTEYTASLLRQLRRRVGRRIPILLLDCGPDDGSRRQAEQLNGSDGCVLITDPEELKHIFRGTERG